MLTSDGTEVDEHGAYRRFVAMTAARLGYTHEVRSGAHAAFGALAMSACTLLVSTGDLAEGSAPGDGDAAATDARGDERAADAGPACDATFCDDFDEPPLGA